MKPVIIVTTKVCGIDEKGTIWEPFGVTPYNWYVYPGDLGLPDSHTFVGSLGEFEIEIKVIQKTNE